MAALAGLAFALSGCGLVQTATTAALTPFANIAANASNDVQVVGSGIGAAASTISQSVSTTSATVSQTATAFSPLAQTATQTVANTSQQMAALSQIQQLQSQAASGSGKPMGPTGPEMNILPPETLKKLTKDQANLQKVVQRIALTAPIGDPVFWYTQGREGTAMVESEEKLGFFFCRTFVQSVTIDGKTDKAHAQSCLSESGNWSNPF